jgi:hypothetical protein
MPPTWYFCFDRSIARWVPRHSLLFIVLAYSPAIRGLNEVPALGKPVCASRSLIRTCRTSASAKVDMRQDSL